MTEYFYTKIKLGTYPLRRGEQIGVICTFAEVHHNVSKRCLVGASSDVQGGIVLRQDVFVKLPAGRDGDQLITLPPVNRCRPP